MLKHKVLTLFFLFFISFWLNGQETIFDIARSGSVDDVKELMEINPDTINVPDKNGFLPLTLACYRGNKDVAIFLASKVKNIDGISSYGTPLMAAVYKNQTEIVQNLIKLNANVNCADSNGTTALHYAIILKNEKIVQLLVEANADINHKDYRGINAIDYATMTQNQKIIQLVNKK